MSIDRDLRGRIAKTVGVFALGATLANCAGGEQPVAATYVPQTPNNSPTRKVEPSTPFATTVQPETPTSVSSTPEPESVLESTNPVCVDTHLNYVHGDEDLEQQLAWMEEMGVAHTRFDFEQGVLNPAEGVWNFSLFDHIVERAKAHGIDVIAMLPQWAAPEWQRKQTGKDYMDLIQSPEDYANYVAKVVEHFKGKINYYEIGNEPDLPGFWRSTEGPNVETYTQYLKAAYKKAKEIDSDAVIISGGVTPEHVEEWLKGMYANGAKDYFDAFGYHPYSQPNGPAERFAGVKVLQEIMRQNGDNKPIIATEVGWPTGTSDESVSEEDQATFIQEIYQRIQKERTFDIACVYQLRDPKDSDPKNAEANFGLVKGDGTHKPAFDEVRKASKSFKVQ